MAFNARIRVPTRNRPTNASNENYARRIVGQMKITRDALNEKTMRAWMCSPHNSAQNEMEIHALLYGAHRTRGIFHVRNYL